MRNIYAHFRKTSKSFLFLLTILLLQGSLVLAQNDPFITVWKTDNYGTSDDNQITIPGTGTDYVIEWEEVGNTSNNGTATATDAHTLTFPSVGIYRVKISGDFQQIQFDNSGDKYKIINIEQWGEISWTSFEGAFYGCENMQYSAVDAPDLSNVTNLRSMFDGVYDFNGDINHWDVSTITDMVYMFWSAKSFNQDLNSWDVSNVERMYGMFGNAASFNGDISSWNVSKVGSFRSMFRQAIAFNQDISNWDISSALFLRYMFDGASIFNQDISNWDVSSAETMDYMFYGATAFDQNLGTWNISSVENMSEMLDYSGLSQENYEATLHGWSQLSTVPSRIELGADGMDYCLPSGRNKLINDKNWSISGDTNTCPASFATLWKTDNAGTSASNEITIPAMGGPYTIEWQEIGNVSNNGSQTGTDETTLVFPSPGTYRVLLSGGLERIQFNNAGDKDKLLEIAQWGEVSWTSFASSFKGCSNLVSTAVDAPDLSGVSDLSQMFSGASSFDANMGAWDVSQVTDMTGMLDNAGLSQENYEGSLKGWYQLANTPQNIVLGVSGRAYCASVGRNALVTAHNWTFSGDTETCAGSFVTIWKTDNEGGSEDNQIIIPGTGTEYVIEWEEVDNISNNGSTTATDAHTLTFPTIGTYRVKISGDFQQIQFDNSEDNYKIINIEQWGDISWTSFEKAFYGCKNMQHTAFDAPDLSNVTNLSSMFDGVYDFNGDIDHWDVSTITDMVYMFWSAKSFNQDLNNWDVSNVEKMDYMFAKTNSFNGDISSWNVSKVGGFGYMFDNAYAFNQDISNWDVSSVETMDNMFYNASAFDQNLGGWNITSVSQMSGMLDYSGLSQENYEATLNGWSQLSTVPSGISLGAYNLGYCFSVGRSILTNDKNWTIRGDSNTCDDLFVTIWQTDSTGSSADNEISIPAVGGPYTVEWQKLDDVSIFGSQTGTDETKLVFPTPGTYRVLISGGLEQIQFNNAGDKDKLVEIEQWGKIAWTSFASSFKGCSNLVSTAIDLPDLTAVTDLSHMFSGASSFDANLEHWNVSTVNNMEGFLDNSGLSSANYDRMLLSWALNSEVLSNITLGAKNLNYCSQEGRSMLIENSNWTFTGDTFDCGAPFVTIWKTDNNGVSDDNQITIPGTGKNYAIEWEEVGNESNSDTFFGSGTETITFPSSGVYRVKLSGSFDRIKFAYGTDYLKIIDIEQWGDISWTSFKNAFWNCRNLQYSAVDAPDLSNVTNMSYMFYGATAFNGDINHWDVSKITNMIYMFGYAESFNQDLNSWDVSNVERMDGMFGNANSFNGDISSWDVSKVVDFSSMFARAYVFNQDISTWDMSSARYLSTMFKDAKAFNQDISNWDVSKVVDFSSMFARAYVFNQDISTWDMSSARDLADMFYEASVFNQDISNWDVSSAETMSSMFYYAPKFNQDLSAWDISSATNMAGMLSGAGLSSANYNKLLISFASLADVPTDITFGAEGLSYCEAREARASLINDYNWNITGDIGCEIELRDALPVAGSINVNIDTELYAVFNMPIFEADFEGISLNTVEGDSISLVGFSISADTLKIAYEGELEKSKSYEAIISAGSLKNIEDGLNEVIIWTFRTVEDELLSNKSAFQNEVRIYPNPFTDASSIEFSLDHRSHVRYYIYDMKGQVVRKVDMKLRNPGKQNLTIERKDLPAGLYQYQLLIDDKMKSGKLVIK